MTTAHDASAGGAPITKRTDSPAAVRSVSTRIGSGTRTVNGTGNVAPSASWKRTRTGCPSTSSVSMAIADERAPARSTSVGDASRSTQAARATVEASSRARPAGGRRGIGTRGV